MQALIVIVFYGAIAALAFGVVYAAARLAFTHVIRKHGVTIGTREAPVREVSAREISANGDLTPQ